MIKKSFFVWLVLRSCLLISMNAPLEDLTEEVKLLRDNLKPLVKNKKSRLEQLKSNNEYARRLQIFASGFYEIDLFFQAIEDHEAVIKQRLSYNKKERLFELQHKNRLEESIDERAQVIFFDVTSREGHAAALAYRDLMLSQDTAVLSELEEAINTLSVSSERDIVLMREILVLRKMFLEDELNDIKTKNNVENIFKHIFYLKYPREVIKGRTEGSPNEITSSVFLEDNLSPLFYIIKTRNLGEIVQKYKYTTYRRDKIRLYNAAILELNRLINEESVVKNFGYRLEINKEEFLPGVHIVIPGQVSASADPSSSMTQVKEDFSWAEPESSELKKVEKKPRRKKTSKSTSTDQQKKSEKDIPLEAPLEQIPVEQALLDDSVKKEVGKLFDMVQFPVQGDELVRAWGVYPIIHKNKVKVPKLPLVYSSLVNSWFEKPEKVLVEYGYHDVKSEKYKRAYAFKDYKNPEEMRRLMKIYHSFPREIDELIKKYGRVEMKKVTTKKGVVEERILITMAGELELKDSILRGLFSYVIDPFRNECYHRMFEPVEKHPFSENYYDIYFLNAE